MSEAHKALVRRFYDEINAGRIEIVDELISEDIVEHDRFPGLEPNRNGVRQLFAMMHQAFEGFRLEVEDVFTDGDTVIARGLMTGTHNGEFMGIAPTGKNVAVPFADFVRIKDGRCVEHWGVTDTGIMMQQLGQA
jgi:steroid delta-isomerase-like uncharacterized protein